MATDSKRKGEIMPNLIFKNFTETSTEERRQILIWRNSDRIRLKMFDQNIISLDKHIKWIDSLKQEKDLLYFLVCLENNPIGVVDFTSLNFIEKSGSFGYYTDEKFTIYAPLIETELLRYFFEELHFDIIYASVLENNQKVYLSHKKYFNFKDIDYSIHYETKLKIFNLCLSKQIWENRKILFERQLKNTLRIKKIFWK
ncbi:MAG: UDP-4-amino-4,6-dideoxy-N-acetyl-beta-L-altrosamine N-acetyltransferase [Alphaproteobacteria bacterium]